MWWSIALLLYEECCVISRYQRQVNTPSIYGVGNYMSMCLMLASGTTLLHVRQCMTLLKGQGKSNIQTGLCVIIFIPSNNYIAHSKNSFRTLRIWEANIKTLNLNIYLWDFGETGLSCLHLNENLLKWLIWYPYVIHPIPGLIGPVVSDIYKYVSC